MIQQLRVPPPTVIEELRCTAFYLLGVVFWLGVTLAAFKGAINPLWTMPAAAAGVLPAPAYRHFHQHRLTPAQWREITVVTALMAVMSCIFAAVAQLLPQ